MWDWLGEGAIGAIGETGLYGRGGLRAIFRTTGGAFSCPFPPSFDNWLAVSIRVSEETAGL